MTHRAADRAKHPLENFGLGFLPPPLPPLSGWKPNAKSL
jgi:hypothetical protein